MDPPIANGTDWHQPGFTAHTTTPTITALPACTARIVSQGCKLDVPQRDERQLAAYRAQEHTKEDTESLSSSSRAWYITTRPVS
jgi:hypothetical protein